MNTTWKLLVAITFAMSLTVGFIIDQTLKSHRQIIELHNESITDIIETIEELKSINITQNEAIGGQAANNVIMMKILNRHQKAIYEPFNINKLPKESK